MRIFTQAARVRPAEEGIPEDTFWHYTSAEGARGILGGKEFWATHARFMNDQQEIQRFWSIVDSVLEGLEREFEKSPYRLGLYGARQSLSTQSVDTFFVISFTTLPDSLSQWRAYSGGTNGYALGFSGSSLRSIGDNWVFRQCIYDQSDAKEIAEKIVAESMEEYQANDAPGPDDFGFFTLINILYPRIMEYAAQIKHEAFEDEKEWRLIGGPFSGVKFNNRISARGITPYVTLAVPRSEDDTIGLTEVVMGPGAGFEMEFSMQNILGMDREFSENVEIYRSFAPYRG